MQNEGKEEFSISAAKPPTGYPIGTIVPAGLGAGEFLTSIIVKNPHRALCLTRIQSIF
jgi:hypothetical protein